MLRVIPAVVFDYLEFSALAFEGIGGGAYDSDDPQGPGIIPNCIMGHADTAGDKTEDFLFICAALQKVGIYESTNDHAISNVHRRFGRFSGRISFKAWCKELNVVRGE